MNEIWQVFAPLTNVIGTIMVVVAVIVVARLFKSSKTVEPDADDEPYMMDKETYQSIARELRDFHAPYQPTTTVPVDHSGYVYVISNSRSFDPRICKIGMTEREDPMKRIKELNRAVPHDYHVHMVIKTANARALETSLHHHFKDRQVRDFALGREFFYVTPQDVRDRLRYEAGCSVILSD